MASRCSDSSDEEFPRSLFDLLQPSRQGRKDSNSNSTQKADVVVLVDSSDTEALSDTEVASCDTDVAASLSPVTSVKRVAEGDLCLGRPAARPVMMVSSDSEDDAPYIPLALRLKMRQESVACVPSAVTNGKHNQPHHADPPRPDQTARGVFSKAEPPFSSLHAQRGTEEAAGDLDDREEDAALPHQHRLPQTTSSWAAASTDSTSPAKKRKTSKRTAEEILASREEALRRKDARQRQQVDKEARRQEQEREKAERKALAETVKALRPEECIKHIVVVVDPALLQLEGGGTLLASLQALGCSCAIEKQPLPRSVTWVRRSPSAQSDDVDCAPEAQVVMQITVDDFISLIHSYTQFKPAAEPIKQSYGKLNWTRKREQKFGAVDCSPTLTSWVRTLQTHNPGRILSLVVIDLEKYFRSHKSQTQKKFREAVLREEQGAGKGAVRKKGKKDGKLTLPEVSRVEVEEAVVHLQLHTGVSVRCLTSWKEFSDHIAMSTKAVAEAPFKRERDNTVFSFYLESEWAGGQRVDRAGKGLLQVWKRQIQQLNRVSPDMAATILAAYPSPQLLHQAYRRCKTDHEKASLLSELLIRRGEGVTSTTRRVGPELSKRLFLMMTSSDPQQALDSNM